MTSNVATIARIRPRTRGIPGGQFSRVGDTRATRQRRAGPPVRLRFWISRWFIPFPVGRLPGMDLPWCRADCSRGRHRVAGRRRSRWAPGRGDGACRWGVQGRFPGRGGNWRKSADACRPSRRPVYAASVGGHGAWRGPWPAGPSRPRTWWRPRLRRTRWPISRDCCGTRCPPATPAPTSGRCSPGPTTPSPPTRPGCSGYSACTPARTSRPPLRPASPACPHRRYGECWPS